MLRVYLQFVALLKLLRLLIEAIEKRDADLARQMRKASASVALNLGEGSGTRGGHRTQRYLTALGSARETMACLDVAVAFGYAEVPDGIRKELHSVIKQVSALALPPRPRA